MFFPDFLHLVGGREKQKNQISTVNLKHDEFTTQTSNFLVCSGKKNMIALICIMRYVNQINYITYGVADDGGAADIGLTLLYNIW